MNLCGNPGWLLAAFAALGAVTAVGCARAAARTPAESGAASESGAAWKAGLAKVCITPQSPVWMSGYSARTKPSEGVLQDLHARALALEDRSGERAVLVTADLIGLSASTASRLTDQLSRRHGLARDRVLLAFSHTHGGPMAGDLLADLGGPNMTEEHRRAIEDYTNVLLKRMAEAVASALKDLRPARLAFGRGEAAFAMNRRHKADKGYQIGENPAGPVDNDVPVLRVESADGTLRAVVFGYACHNTTMGGGIYELNGDYAGFAETGLEARHAGAVALFVMGCGGDINPHPREALDLARQRDLARQHGQTLADVVDRALAGPMRPVNGGLRTAYETVSLPFAPPPTRETLRTLADDPDLPRRDHARKLLAVMDRGDRLPAAYPCPVQAWRLGKEVTLVALGGEAVVDYALRLKKELGPEGLWVAAYANDVFAYVPSRRVLKEGGYEPERSMLYYGHPGPFAAEVEDILVRKVREVVARVRGE
jgi:hypothetical protein